MSAYIDVEITGKDTETEEKVSVYFAGYSDQARCWIEVGDQNIELDVRDLHRAVLYAELLDG